MTRSFTWFKMGTSPQGRGHRPLGEGSASSRWANAQTLGPILRMACDLRPVSQPP